MEMLQNSGKEQIIDLMEARIKVAEATMQNLIAAGIYSDGTANGGKQIGGLLVAVAKVPTRASTAASTARRGRSGRTKRQICCGGAATAANIQQLQRDVREVLRVAGPHRPDHGGQRLLGAVHGVPAGDPAFHRQQDGGSRLPDGQVHAGRRGAGRRYRRLRAGDAAYFLNTKYIFFRPHRDRNFVALDPSKRYTVNQDAVVQTWHGRATCACRARSSRA